ncbi:DUF2935 domain-containing protein [Candidatus Dependentiae bacterium]|nr:DUF2935 domain-containing protein [Candidatus Dependentiae bacterium]
MNIFKIIALCALTPAVLIATGCGAYSPSSNRSDSSSQEHEIQSLNSPQSSSKQMNSKSFDAFDALESSFQPLDSKSLSSAERFRQIKANPAKARNEIDFWARQLSEHALFLHLGIEDLQLKKRGLELHKRFEAFRKNMSDKTMNQILPLTRELRAYKMDVVNTLKSGKWIGWIFPSFAKHIVRELDYFVDKLNGVPYSKKQEVKFWDKINSDHAAFAARLLDPKERESSITAEETSMKIADIASNDHAGKEEAMFIKISLKASKELDEFNRKTQKGIKQNTVQSVIHPVLIDHVVREGKRSIEILSKLQKVESTKEDSTKDSTNQEQEAFDQNEEQVEQDEATQY